MTYDEQKVDDVVLALMYLTLGDPGERRAWKGFPWPSLDRLWAKGLIADPKNKAKSVLLTEAGEQACEQLFQSYFCTAA